MLAGGALCRLAGPKTSARDLPQLVRFLGRALLSRNASRLPAARALTAALDTRRSYATTAAATKPTATVRRAVKAQAASKAAPKTKAAAKTTSKTVKKPATKKAKPKAKKTAKKASKKPTAKKKTVKQALTAEQKEAANTKKEKAKLTELRKRALKAPVSPIPLTAFNVYLQEQAAGKGQAGTSTERLTEKSRAFKSLTPAEHEHYNHLAREKSATRQAEYRAWIHSYTPQQIQDANNARSQLRRLLKNASKRKYPAYSVKLIDDRHVKRARGAFTFFFGERMSSGDMKGIKVSESSKLVAEEWKALSASEKKKYEDEAAADAARAQREKAALA